MFELLLVVLLVVAWLVSQRRSSGPRPPGPPRLPLLGSLPFLDTSRGFLGWTLDPIVTKHR